jgi:CheY-like chemotaxis protein
MPTILVVEDDPALLKLTCTVLRHAGHVVREASNGEEALELTKETSPDLIVTDIMMPAMDGWTLVKQLRTQRHTAFTPILFLTQLDSYDDRVKGFRLGADDYLTKPFTPRELVARVERMLDPDAIFKDTAGFIDAGSDMEGKLERIGMSAVMVMLESERKTGVLTVESSGETCRVWFRAGATVRAEIKGRAEVRGADAVYHALNWTHGSFEFIECRVEGADEIGMATTYLLIEGARRIDEGVR